MDNPILLALQSIAELLGWTILHSLWQITLIALVLKLVLKWTSKYDATIRYALGISALFVATFWSGYTFLETLDKISITKTQSVSNNLIKEVTPTIISETIYFPPNSYLENVKSQSAKIIAPLMPFLAIFWFVGILFFASRILIGLFRLNHFSKHGIQVLPNAWVTRLLTLQQLSGIHRPIKVRLSHLVESPITYQFFRPIILLPISLFTHLSDEQIEVLLLHELAHIKRQDYLVNLLQSCIEVLFFYHPLIWWMSKQVRLEREHCCDDRVMNLRHQPMLYAQTLTQIQGQHFSHKTKLAMSATGNTGDFSKRIYRLFIQKDPNATLRNSAAALLLLLLSGVMMAFYPTSSTPNISINTSPILVQDTIPKKLSTDSDANLKKEAKAVALQSELISLEIALHENVKALKVEKNKGGIQNEANLEELQSKTEALKKELHLKTQELKQLTDSYPEIFGFNAYENETFLQKAENNSLILPHFKGKKPFIYLDNEPYKKWKIDENDNLFIDVPSDEVYAINEFKEENAVALFGPKAKDGVVYINTKANPNSLVPAINNSLKHSKNKEIQGNTDKLLENDKSIKTQQLVVLNGETSPRVITYEPITFPNTLPEDIILSRTITVQKDGEEERDRVIKIYTKSNEALVSNKKSLVVIDGKVSQKTVEDIDPDNIATINVRGDVALEKYGKTGKGDVIEIYTKGNEPKEKAAAENLKEKARGNSFTLKNDNSDKKPLVVIDGKVSEKRVKDLDTDKIGVMNVVKGEAAIKKYGEAGKNGVVEIYTKGNEPAGDFKGNGRKVKIKEKTTGNSFGLKNDNADKKPLVVIDGKVSQKGVKDLDTDKIGVMNVLKGEAALNKYGAQGKNGVVEIYTKGNEPAEKPANAKKKVKLNGAVGTPKSEKEDNIWINATGANENKVYPLFVIDGKKLPRSTKSPKDLSPDEIAAITVLKDERALEKYGEEGANGVVEIITKANKEALKAIEKEKKTKLKEKKAKEKKLKAKQKKLKTTQKELKVKQKELKVKQKEKEARKKELKEIQSPAAGLSVFPNPTRQLTNIQLNLAQKGNVKVDILTINGQVVLHLVNDTLDKGVHQFQWNSDTQPAGSYFVHFNLDGVLMSKQVVVKK